MRARLPAPSAVSWSGGAVGSVASGPSRRSIVRGPPLPPHELPPFWTPRLPGRASWGRPLPGPRSTSFPSDRACCRRSAYSPWGRPPPRRKSTPYPSACAFCRLCATSPPPRSPYLTQSALPDSHREYYMPELGSPVYPNPSGLGVFGPPCGARFPRRSEVGGRSVGPPRRGVPREGSSAGSPQAVGPVLDH